MANNPQQDEQGRDERHAQPDRPERDNSGPGQERPESEDIDEDQGDIERPQ